MPLPQPWQEPTLESDDQPTKAKAMLGVRKSAIFLEKLRTPLDRLLLLFDQTIEWEDRPSDEQLEDLTIEIEGVLAECYNGM